MAYRLLVADLDENHLEEKSECRYACVARKRGRGREEEEKDDLGFGTKSGKNSINKVVSKSLSSGTADKLVLGR